MNFSLEPFTLFLTNQLPTFFGFGLCKKKKTNYLCISYFVSRHILQDTMILHLQLEILSQNCEKYLETRKLAFNANVKINKLYIFPFLFEIILIISFHLIYSFRIIKSLMLQNNSIRSFILLRSDIYNEYMLQICIESFQIYFQIFD